MIIDLLLDRRDGENYNAHNFYWEVLQYESCFDLRDIGINISAAMDGGTNEDVQRELCKYIVECDYPLEICEYINSVNWI